MANRTNYSHENYIQNCLKYKNLIPIAGVDPNTLTDNELDKISLLGFKGIKIHPRFSNFKVSENSDRLIQIFNKASNKKLVVFYCTYAHCSLQSYPKRDPFYDLINILSFCPSAKVVLVHGGDVALMKYAELVRFNHNLLLDLSLTFMKYSGSSIDMDIHFLFRNFDRRICIGTDFPEYTLDAVLTKFNFMCEGLSSEKVENIAHKNILNFFYA